MASNLPRPQTVHGLLSDHAARAAAAPAILAAEGASATNAASNSSPANSPLSYGGLMTHTRAVARRLRAEGVQRGDRVAMVLPNGPDMASAFVTVASAATAAPLNPNYRAAELEFYMSDLGARVLLIQRDMESDARAVARKLGVPILELEAGVDVAGRFTIAGGGHVDEQAEVELAGPDDVALVLHTSGTTSRPKIVPLRHRNVCATARNVGQTLALTHADRCLNVMPLFHIHGLMAAVLSVLGAGASVVCTPGFLAPRFFGWLERHAPSFYTAVPTMHQAILARAGDHSTIIEGAALRFIRSSSASLPPAVMAELERVFRAPVIESYGMTEAAHQMTSNPLPPAARKPGTVGTAAGPEVAIMDVAGELLPQGEVGEIVIRGDNVTDGYEANEDANRSAFTNGWFRTGDQGTLDVDGYLTITGRLKEIINRAGEKVSPREVDERLLDHPAVRQAVTFALPHPLLGEAVAAAIVRKPGMDVDERALREFAAERLADFKVPERIVFLDEVPKGPTGKLQRIGLADKLGLSAAPAPTELPATPYQAPRNEREQQLCALWQDVLGRDQVGVTEPFINAGGDSMLGAQIIGRVRQQFGVRVSMIALFDQAATIEGLSALIDAGGEDAQEESALAPVPDGDRTELSPSQQRMWLTQQLAPPATPLNRITALTLDGPLDRQRLSAAIDTVVARHEILRTAYPIVDGRALQRVLPPSAISMDFVDLGDVHEDEQEGRLHERLRAASASVNDWEVAPPLAVTLVGLAEQRHVLALVTHHIVIDGLSVAVWVRELARAYVTAGGSGVEAEALPLQYADYAAWQRERVAGPLGQRQLDYWRTALANAAGPGILPSRQPPSRKRGFRAARQKLALPLSLTAELKQLGRRHQCTLFMTLMAACQVVLNRYSGFTDICVATAVSGRARPELDGLIGNFINTVVLRTDLSGAPSFDEVLKRVRRVALDAYAHQDVPFERILQELPASRAAGRNPLFDMMLVLKDEVQPETTPSGLQLSPLRDHVSDAVLVDLTLELWDSPQGLHGAFEYNRDVFDADVVERLAGHLTQVLTSVVSQPELPMSSLSLLNDEQRRSVLVDWNDTAAPYANDTTVAQLFRVQCDRTPDAIAVVAQDGELTYVALLEAVEQLADVLRKRGVGPGTITAVCLERSAKLLVGLLAIMEAGGAYLPLDPGYPSERIAFMLADSGAGVVLTQQSLQGALPQHEAIVVCVDHAPDQGSEAATDARGAQASAERDVSAQDLAYVIYTSGSTGKPKGVKVPHRATVNFLQSMAKRPGLTAKDRLLAVTTAAFDISVLELLLPITVGARVIVATSEESADGRRLLERLVSSGATVMQATPATWRLLLHAGWTREQPVKVLCGGEALPRDLARELIGHSDSVWNMYGPTETTVWSSCYPLTDRDAPVLIGKPIANTQMYVLDGDMQPLPVGVSGDLYIGGAGVTDGYLDRPALTAERFVHDPFSADTEARLYRTGDRARYHLGGDIEYLSRIDQQVKVRGFRIELEEIEAQLSVSGHLV
jgi:amino acid adenylation domain-containing protein